MLSSTTYLDAQVLHPNHSHSLTLICPLFTIAHHLGWVFQPSITAPHLQHSWFWITAGMYNISILSTPLIITQMPSLLLYSPMYAQAPLYSHTPADSLPIHDQWLCVIIAHPHQCPLIIPVNLQDCSPVGTLHTEADQDLPLFCPAEAPGLQDIHATWYWLQCAFHPIWARRTYETVNILSRCTSFGLPFLMCRLRPVVLSCSIDSANCESSPLQWAWILTAP